MSLEDADTARAFLAASIEYLADNDGYTREQVEDLIRSELDAAYGDDA
jgi:hypothetical protein